MEMLPIYQLSLFKIILDMMVANYARYGAGNEWFLRSKHASLLKSNLNLVT
jgi:hypothetical protein